LWCGRLGSSAAGQRPAPQTLLGFDHERFTYAYQGLDQRLTGVEPAKVIDALQA
jgi:hypothetical protein